MSNRRYDCDPYGRPQGSSSQHSGYDSRNRSSSSAGSLPGNSGPQFYPQNSDFPSQLSPYGAPQQQVNYMNDVSRQVGGYNGIPSQAETPTTFSYHPYAQNSWDPRLYPSQPPNVGYSSPSMPYPPTYGPTPSGVQNNNIKQSYPNQALQGAPYYHVSNQQPQQSTWVSAASVPPADLTRQELYNDAAPTKPRSPSADRKDTTEPKSTGKIAISQAAEEKQPEKETKKPIPIMVGKRRGGRVLPTGVVKKQRTGTSTQGRTDAWGQYMAEVKKYKEQSCEEERKNRPLVK